MKKSDNFLIGIHAVNGVLAKQPERIKQLYAIQGSKNNRVKALLDKAKQLGLAMTMLNKVSFESRFAQGVQAHQGIAAEVQLATSLNENDLKEIVEVTAQPVLFLVLDGVTDPHNLGACFRSADAFGVDAIITPKDKSAGINATVSKVACGATETVPFVQVTNLARTLKYLQEAGVWLFGAAGETTQTLYQQDFVSASAIVMGAEGSGLRRLTKETCDALFAIPMLGTVESLNVSVATGICLSEAQRQRSL